MIWKVDQVFAVGQIMMITIFKLKYSEQDHYIDEEYQLTRVEIALPDILTFIIEPEVITYMEMDICDINPEFGLEILEYALTHCPNLQCFEFKSINDHYQDICIATYIIL